MGYSRIKIFALWVSVGYFCTLLGIIPSVIYWHHKLPSWEINGLNEAIGSAIMAPFGWILFAIIPMSWQLSPASWVSITAFIYAVKKRTVKPLYISFVACFIFGLFWPYTFWALMSV